jgi:hypothetical protein
LETISASGSRPLALGMKTATVFVALLITCASSSRAQSALPMPLVVVQRLLAAAFPDIRDDDARVTVTIDSPFDKDWASSQDIVLSVTPRKFRAPAESNDTDDAQFLRGHVVLSQGYIFQASFSGQRVKSREMRAVTAEAAAHPDWTTAQLQAALTQAGAKYGPDSHDRFTDSLHLDRFAEALGILQLTAVRFSWRLGRSDLGSDDVISPTWVIEANTHDQQGRHICYAILAEPFGGAIRSVLGRLCE